MYGIGDRVIYGAHGVCRIAGTEERMIDHKKQTYLVLEPATGAASRYYVPMHNASAMGKLHPLLTRGELEALLCSAEVRMAAWIPEDNRRKQMQRELLSCGDRLRLIQAVYVLYRHRELQKSTGHKVHMSDENFLHDAEKLLASEIESVLEMDNQCARAYLQDQLAKRA